MKRLAIGDGAQDITLYQESGPLVYKRAIFGPPRRIENLIEEHLELVLEDANPEVIVAAEADLAAMLRKIEEYHSGFLDRPVCLRISDAGGKVWASRLHGARMERSGGDSDNGSLGLRLIMRREDFWQGEERELPLSNRNGANVIGGLSVSNHSDTHAGHDNFVDIASSDVEGDLPSSFHIEMLNSGASGTLTGDIRVGISFRGDVRSFWHVLEAEEASGGTLKDDVAASGGGGRTVSWNTAGERDLLAWRLSILASSRAMGRWFRPLVRLMTPVMDDDLWLGIKVAYGSGLASIKSYPPGLAAAGKALVELPAAQIPPFTGGTVNLGQTEVRLYAWQAEGQARSLDVDDLMILPLDGWRNFQSTGGLESGWRLVDEGEPGACYSVTATGERLITHADFGRPLSAIPGRPHRIYFLQECGGLAPIERTLTVRVFYRPRRIAV